MGDVDPQERNIYNNITIDYQITAPRGVALNLRTGSGDIEVDNLGRFLKAQSGSGSIRAHGISGTADLESGSGDIELQEQSQANVQAVTGSGSIRIQGLNGGLVAHTGSGDIEAGGQLGGAAKLQTGSGFYPAAPRVWRALQPERKHRFRRYPHSGSSQVRRPPHQRADQRWRSDARSAHRLRRYRSKLAIQRGAPRPALRCEFTRGAKGLAAEQLFVSPGHLAGFLRSSPSAAATGPCATTRPFSSRTTSASSRKASPTSCVTESTGLPRSHPRSWAINSSRTPASSPVNGSSSNSTRPRAPSAARTTATRCCSPPESAAGFLPARGPRAKCSSAWLAILSEPPAAAKPRFSRTVMRGNSVACCPLQRMGRACAGSRRLAVVWFTTLPSILTAAKSALAKPARIRSTVLLPLPEGPNRIVHGAWVTNATLSARVPTRWRIAHST